MKIAATHILALFLIFLGRNLHSQELPEPLQRVLQSDTAFTSLSCEINLHVDVPGLSIPDKEISLELEKGKKPKIKGKGLIILPKRGIIGQYRDFLDQSVQAIPMGEEGDTLFYKVVSLDKETDWVTVDLSLTYSDSRVHRMVIATRKNGEFEVDHFYGNSGDVIPQRTEIVFEAMPLKLPLKFMGQQYAEETQIESNGPVSGKIVLEYSKVEIQ